MNDFNERLLGPIPSGIKTLFWTTLHEMHWYMSINVDEDSQVIEEENFAIPLWLEPLAEKCLDAIDMVLDDFVEEWKKESEVQMNSWG